MSTIAIEEISGSAFIAWADQGLSQEAEILRQRAKEASDFSTSMTFGEPTRNAQEALNAAYAIAQVENWDEEGAKKVELSTYIYANQFLTLLPGSLPIPEVTADIDGEIFFEWDLGRRQVFSVSIGRDGTLTYAALIGHTKTHGTAHFQEPLPAVISDCFVRLLAASEP